MTSLLTRYMADESGATAIDYSLMVIGVSVAIAAATPEIGTVIGQFFSALASVF